MKLNELSPQKGSTKNATRVGRGMGSGTGKTSGKGQKGQKSRSGVAINGFEGGQMPLYRRLPKRGFNAINPKRFAELNLGKLQEALDAKKLDAKGVITEAMLVEAGLVRRVLDGVRLLAKGELKTKLSLKVTGASKPALAAVEKAGGKVEFLSVEEKREIAKSNNAAKKADAKPAAKKETAKKAAPKKETAKKAPAKKAPAKKTAAKKTTKKDDK